MDAAAGGIAVAPLKVLQRLRRRREEAAAAALCAAAAAERAAEAAHDAAQDAVRRQQAALRRREAALFESVVGRPVPAHRLLAGRRELDVMADRTTELGARSVEADEARRAAGEATAQARQVLTARLRVACRWDGVVERVETAQGALTARILEAEQDDEFADRWRPW